MFDLIYLINNVISDSHRVFCKRYLVSSGLLFLFVMLRRKVSMKVAMHNLVRSSLCIQKMESRIWEGSLNLKSVCALHEFCFQYYPLFQIDKIIGLGSLQKYLLNNYEIGMLSMYWDTTWKSYVRGFENVKHNGIYNIVHSSKRAVSRNVFRTDRRQKPVFRMDTFVRLQSDTDW